MGKMAVLNANEAFVISSCGPLPAPQAAPRTAIRIDDGVSMADITFGHPTSASALVAASERSAKRAVTIGVCVNDFGHTVILAPIMKDGSVGAAEVPIDKASLPDLIDVLRRVHLAGLERLDPLFS